MAAFITGPEDFISSPSTLISFKTYPTINADDNEINNDDENEINNPSSFHALYSPMMDEANRTLNNEELVNNSQMENFTFANPVPDDYYNFAVDDAINDEADDDLLQNSILMEDLNGNNLMSLGHTQYNNDDLQIDEEIFQNSLQMNNCNLLPNENANTIQLENELLMEMMSQESEIPPSIMIPPSPVRDQNSSTIVRSNQESSSPLNNQAISSGILRISPTTAITTNTVSTLTKKIMDEIMPSTPQPIIMNNIVPEGIRNLYNLITNKLTETSFVYAISAQLGHDIRPMDFNVNLKMALLFSIVSIDDKSERSPIPIIVIGNDTSTINMIMNRIGNLAQRFIRTLDTFNGGFLSNKNTNMEAGPLLLSKEGVCYMGDWSRIKPKNVNQLLRFIENDQVILDKSTITYKLQCSIWSYFTIMKPKKDIKSLLTFLNIFGIPIIADDNINDSVIDFILLQSMTNSNMEKFPNVIPEEDMRNYLYYVSNIKVQFSPEASALMNSYFVATRMNTPEVLSQRSFISLKQIAESSSKLCFRSEVQVSDVLIAIYFSELYIKAIFGPAINNSPVNHTITDIVQVDSLMETIKIWVYDFIESQTGQNRSSLSSSYL